MKIVNMDGTKRIYSLGCIAYLAANGHTEDYIGVDENNGDVYFVFSDSASVVEAIRDYRNDLQLREYNHAYHAVKAKMKDIKNRVG